MRVIDRSRSRSEGEEIVHRGGDLGGSFVAVTHYPGDPARVRRTAANDASQLLAQAADPRHLGPRMVVVPHCRRAPGGTSDNQAQPALQLEDAVAAEQDVLPGVLVV